MKAITMTESGLGVEAMTLTEIDYPQVAENDIIVRVHAAGFTTIGELTWPGTWIDRADPDRTPSVPGPRPGRFAELHHELATTSTRRRSPRSPQ
jgi:NADPH:quinone reductase-like Zn-dependent oxidoreductase